MRMKKIAMLGLALVLCLAVTGAGFAHWTDEVTIAGTVTTGNVDLDIVKVSGTWVYKIVDTGQIIVHHGDEPAPPAGAHILVASTTATYTETPTNVVTINGTNLFPCPWFYIDILLHYDGTIPAHLSITDVVFTDGGAWMQELIDSDQAYAKAYESDVNGTKGDEINLVNLQVHQCKYILIELYLHIPQTLADGTTTQNLTATGSCTITATQIEAP